MWSSQKEEMPHTKEEVQALQAFRQAFYLSTSFCWLVFVDLHVGTNDLARDGGATVARAAGAGSGGGQRQACGEQPPGAEG